jgi:hypothetical protein
MEVRSKAFWEGAPLIGFIDLSASEIKARSCSAFARAKVAQCATPFHLIRECRQPDSESPSRSGQFLG